MKFLTGLIVILIGAAHAEKIPLKDVWAYNMPGTQELTDAMRHDGYISEEGPLVSKIRSELTYELGRKVASVGGVVVGSRDEALQQSLDFLTSEDDRETTSLQIGDDAWILFFAYESASYVQIDSVTRARGQFTINYRFVPHRTRETTSHFALIPIGPLVVGKHRVCINRLPLRESEVSQGLPEIAKKWEQRLVSQPFSFEVTESPK